MIQGTPVNIIVGSHVWAEDPEVAWIDGEVTEIRGNDATIVTTSEKTVSQHCPAIPITANTCIAILFMTERRNISWLSMIRLKVNVNLRSMTEYPIKA